MMEEIENILKSRNIPIYNRPIHAPLEVTKKLKISIPWLPIQGKASPGIYNTDNLAAHIHNWYGKKYGDRLKVQMGIGSGIILIRNDPWRVIYPMIFGTGSFICVNDLEKFKDSPVFTTNGTPPIINILNIIEDIMITQNLCLHLN